MWIAGLLICLLTPLGMVVIGRSIPASYASIPDKGTSFRNAPAVIGAEDAYQHVPQVHRSVARGTAAPTNQARCPGCGVIQSIREVRLASDVGVASTTPATSYEMTIRFRDGSTKVFNEASPRNWKTGNRVIMIGRANASS
jgi:hypothetical protein